MYRELISAATRVTDPKRLALIEDWMRQQTRDGCLDSLSRTAFIGLARRADDDLTQFARAQPVLFQRHVALIGGAL